ncbi:MAG TPA: chemotaxis response regulator protein-glutamate methylesterase [Candidatus Angelobacter sp.]|nr:chemotaxis response regulator protein-glutamate methylesterase [Candidatus Angelobacter sp.]
MQNHSSPFPIQVLVVDDSAVVRQVMHAILSQETDMEVTVAADPLIAMQKMKQMRPHVVVLDLEMPRMDGLTFLRKIMAEDPIPTLVCSGVAAPRTENALVALEQGAVGIISKPKLGVGNFLHESALVLIDTVRAAAQASVKQRVPLRNAPKLRPASVPALHPPVRPHGGIVAIGASIGGTEALAELLTALPSDAPGIVIVQHMPEFFTSAFANRLNALCRIEVKEGADGDQVVRGRAIIAPGNRHLSVVSRRGAFYVELSDGPLVSRHRPSVDVLFRSVASAAGANALGIILTGMGNDGASGLLDMKRAGSSTIAQDEKSCVVFGMPKEAIAAGAVDSIAPLASIPRLVMAWAGSGRVKTMNGKLHY